MSYSGSSMSSGSGSSRRTFEFGRTHVVRPKGKHQATIVWLHGLGDNGSRLGHYTVPEETDEVCRWLTANLGLEGFRLN
ncbi:hypothetical protein JHK85_014956 [Glycine max]|nr:hypothetical protein JHK85_014956 [Glycine max]